MQIPPLQEIPSVSRFTVRPFRRICVVPVVLVIAFPDSTGLQAQAKPVIAPVTAAARTYTSADVAFMQGMIGHHAQALEMTALIAQRLGRTEMAMLGERISVSQRDEIRLMATWLRDRGETVPVVATSGKGMDHSKTMSGMDDAAGAPGNRPMPGMLSPARMDSLRTSRGATFDTRFLRYMIQHHEGALLMVKQLVATPGAAEEPQVYGFASDVDTDQRAEIRRMQALLNAATRPAASRKPQS